MSDRLQVWGRTNSVNVQKVLWCCEELNLPFDRIDAGLQFGRVDTAEYRAMNPNGRVPTIVDGDFVLWESNAIMRYLALKHAVNNHSFLYPEEAARRARIEQWLDWTLSVLQPAERDLFWGMIRTRQEDRDAVKIRSAIDNSGNAWRILDAHLRHGHHFVEGDHFTLADIALGTYARRWFGVEVKNRPDLTRLRMWYDRLQERSGFVKHVAQALS